MTIWISIAVPFLTRNEVSLQSFYHVSINLLQRVIQIAPESIFSSYHLFDCNELPLLVFIPSPHPLTSTILFLWYSLIVSFYESTIPKLIANPLTLLGISPPLYMTLLEHWHHSFSSSCAHNFFQNSIHLSSSKNSS